MKFFLYDENTNIEYSFDVNTDPRALDDGTDLYDELLSWMADEEIESKYGVQDAVGDKHGSGFNSYEVPAKKYLELLNKYRDFFRTKGLKVSSQTGKKKVKED